MQFGTMAHTDPLYRINRQNFEFIKSKVADGRHLVNSHKLPYFNNGFTDCHEIWHYDSFGPSASYLPLKFKYSVIQDGGWPPFWKLENHHMSATGWPMATTFDVMTHIPIIDPLHSIGRVSWRHSNQWSRYDIHVVGDVVLFWEVNWLRFVTLFKLN